LSVSSDGFSPESFTVSSGQAITVALTGVGESSHIMAFEDSVLSSVFINTRPGETRAVTFNAPSEPGEYTFFCDFPGHRSAEEGIMVVE
jgi:plastocyanin